MKIPMPAGQEVPVTAQPIAPRLNGAALAQPYAEASSGLQHLARTEAIVARQEEHQQAVLEATKTMGQARVDGTQMLIDAQQNAPAGAQDFTKGFLDSWDEKSKEILDGASENARPFVAQHLAVLRSELANHALAFEGQQIVAKKKSDLEDALTLHANAVRTDPTQFETALGEVTAALDGSGLSGDNYDKAVKHIHGTMGASLVDGWIDRDPTKARELLDGGTLDTYLAPAVKNQLVDRAQAKIDKTEREAQALLRGDVKAKYEDEIAAIRDRGYGLGLLTPGMIQKAYPEDAPELIKNLDTERQFYNARQSVAFTSPDEDEALLKRYMPEGSGYADQVKRREILAKAMNEKYKALGKDPVGYIASVSKPVQAAFDAASADPSKLPAALALSDQAQARLGVPDYARRILSDSQAQDLVGKASSGPPDQVASLFQGLATSYGAYWPRAYEDLVRAKLPPSYQVLATIDNPAARTQLVEATRAGGKALRDTIGTENATAVDKTVDDALSPFTRTLSAAPNGAQLGDAWKKATQLLAYRYVNMGATPDDAVTRAARDIALDRYDFAESGGYNARAPKGTLDQVENFATRTLAALKPEDIEVPPRAEGEVDLTDDQRAAAYFRDGVKNGAQWVTSPRDDGWILLDAARQPVTRKDGSVVAITFKDALDAGITNRQEGMFERDPSGRLIRRGSE
jgi:hypothetical protein